MGNRRKQNDPGWSVLQRCCHFTFDVLHSSLLQVRWFVRSSVRSLVRLLVRSFVHSLIRSLVRSQVSRKSLARWSQLACRIAFRREKNRCSKALKSMPGGVKIGSRRLQNRSWSAPRRHFGRLWVEEGNKRQSVVAKNAIWSQLGSKLEAQEPPKSKAKPQKIDVGKQAIFSIDFWRVRTSF